MAKIVYNACYGGFGLSPEATLRLYELGAPIQVTPVDEYWPPEKREEDKAKWATLGYDHAITAWRQYLASDKEKRRHLFLHVFSPDEKFVLCARDIPRNDPMLIQVLEEMGGAASGDCGSLKIAEIPDGARYRIDEFDGYESVMTPDDYEWKTA